MPGTRLAWDGGLGLDTDSSGGAFDPDVIAPPSPLPERTVVVKCIDSVAQDGTQFTPAKRGASLPYARHRIVVGGVDVTYFRGVETPLPQYGLQEPLLFGSGVITFPQVHAAYDQPGHGDLSWLTKFATVRVQRVDDDGHVIEGGGRDYVGFISDLRHDGRTLSCTLGGQAAGAASMQYRPVPIFPRPYDLGHLVQRTISERLKLSTANEPVTGIVFIESGGVSQLDYLTEVLAQSSLQDGRQWTVMPNADGLYRMFKKDITTIDATIYLDGFHNVPSLRRDYTQESNRVWSTGIDQDGMRLRPANTPGLAVSSHHPAFPGTLSPGDSGDDVLTLVEQLWISGYIDGYPPPTVWTTDDDDPITLAVNDLQEDGHVTASPGVVNAATWAALFDPSVVGLSLRGTAQKPTVQRSYTNPYLRGAFGRIIGLNPDYVRSAKFVDDWFDMGRVNGYKQLRQFSQQEMADDNAPNWSGTIVVNTGAVIRGEHNPGDPLSSDDVMDVREVLPGMNLWLPGWGTGDGTLIHVAGSTITPQVGVNVAEFAVDTRNRDAMKVWEIRKRNRESRRNASRNPAIAYRRSQSVDDTGAYYDGGNFGKIPRTFCPADAWTVIGTPAGRAGVIQILDIQTDSDPAAFGLAIFGKHVDGDWCDSELGDPFATGWTKRVRLHTKKWRANRWLVDVWGQASQPCGYWPGQHTADDDGDGVGVTDETITGQFHDETGFNYFCQGSPGLWIAVRPDRDTWVQGGRALTLLLMDSAG